MTLDQWIEIELARQGFQSEPQDYLYQIEQQANGKLKFTHVTKHWWHPNRGGKEGDKLK